MKKGILYIICTGLLAASCAQDEGNYTYRDISAPTVTGIDAEINILKNERLQLSPVIAGEDYNASDCDFEWKVISDNDADTATVIGKERELDILMLLPEDTYRLYFTITDRTREMYWQNVYSLKVAQSTTEGWMVLCAEGDGATRLDMISAVTGNTYYDLLKGTGAPEYQGPRRIQQLEGYTDSDSPFYLLTDEGATRLGTDAFAWKEEYLLQYEMGDGSANTAPYEMVTTNHGKMMVADGNFHYSSCMSFIGLFDDKANKDFKVAPMIGSNVAASYVAVPVMMTYDIDGKRFMGYVYQKQLMELPESMIEMNELASIANNRWEKNKKEGNGVSGTAFEEFPQGLDYVYMENTRYVPGGSGKMAVTYTILAEGEKRYLYGIQLGDMLPPSWGECQSALGKFYYGDLSACTDITKAELFAFSSVNRMMYYAVGGTLYRVNLDTRQAEKQFTLPAGEEITRLKFNLFQKTKNLNRSYDLIVGSLQGEEGILRIYRDNDLSGDFSKIEPEVYKGFARIVDVTYREW